MNRFACTALLLFLAAALAEAQPANNRSTGLSSSSGLGTQEMLDYLRAFRTANTSIEVETSGATRRMLGAHKISITANWRKVRGSDGPVLQSATIRPTAGGRLKLGDLEINKLTINSKGEIHVDKTGIDVTIYKITRKANGDLVLDLPWFVGDKTIAAADVPFDIKKWPPELQELIEALMNPRNKGATATGHEARVAWDISGEADPHPLPFADGNLKVASSARLRGAGQLRPDGSFQTVGDGNTLSLQLEVNRGGRIETNGGAGGNLNAGRASFNGRYGINIPAAGGSFGLTVDGRVEYSLDGNRITLKVPGGPTLTAANGHIDGNGRVNARFGSTGSTVALRDGVYNLNLTGPIGLQGLATEAFTLDDLEVGGTISSRGTIEELSADRILARGAWNGDLTAENAVGIEGRMRGEQGYDFRLRRGSNLKVKSDDARLDVRLTGPEAGASVTGKVEAEADLGVEDAELRGDKVEGHVERARVTGRVTGDLGGPNGEYVRNLNGTLGVDVERGGAVTGNNTLPGAPNLPAGRREHTVKAGETLHDIARAYGVSTERLQRANGLSTPGKDRYRVNADSLRVRAAASTDGTQIGSLLRGDVVEVDGVTAGWAKLATGGYASADYLEALPADPSTGIRPGQKLTIPGGAPQVATPGRGFATTRIEDGTSAAVELNDGSVDREGRLRAKGFVSATLKLRDLDLRSDTLQARLLAQASATLPRTAFELGGATPALSFAEVKIPVRIDLSEGSRFHTTDSAGREMDVQFDRAGSFMEFNVVARFENGKLTIPELQNVDLLLHSNGAAKFAGEVVDVSGDKSIRYTGRMVFLPNGIDFIGDIAVIVSGGERPAVRIRW